MDTNRQFAAGVVLLGAMSLTLADGILSERAAVEVAKQTLKDECTSATPCTFSAAREKNQWVVRAQFTKRNSPQEKPFPYPGGHATLFISDGGKVIRRLNGE
jgi:hypothetical protein